MKLIIIIFVFTKYNHIANIKHDPVNSFTGVGTATPQIY